MNARYSVVLLLTLFLGYSPSRAALAAALPPEIRTTTNANAVRPQIQNMVNEKVSVLTGDDTAAISGARDAIVAEMDAGKGTGSIQPSAEFLRAYAEAVAAALEPLSKNHDPRVRLNVGVLVARVAEKSPSLKLAPIAQTLLADDSEAVVLWGMKSCKFLIPAVLGSGPTGKSSPLMPAFVQAATHYKYTGPMMQTAYESLRIDNAIASMTTATWNASVSTIVDCVHELLAQRLELYNQGIPDIPSTETSAMTFLTDEGVWNKQSPAQQLRSVQLLSDLIAVAAQRAGAPNMTSIERSELIDLLKLTAKGLTVVGKWIHNESGMDEAVASLRVLLGSVSTADLKKNADQVYPGLKKIPQFKALKEPPKLPAQS